MKIEGGCHCGRITYEAEIDPDGVALCHCVDCQKMSSTAFRTIVFVTEDNFRLLSGELKTYIKTAESGNQRAQMFCGDCGTHFYATGVWDGPKTYGLRVGTAYQRSELRPKGQYFYQSAVSWLKDIDFENLERIEGSHNSVNAPT